MLNELKPSFVSFSLQTWARIKAAAVGEGIVFLILLKHTSNIISYLLVAYIFSVKLLFFSLGKGHNFVHYLGHMPYPWKCNNMCFSVKIWTQSTILDFSADHKKAAAKCMLKLIVKVLITVGIGLQTMIIKCGALN